MEGTLEKVRFESEDGLWSVVAVSLGDDREINAVGNLGGARPGELLRLTGRWVVHPKFGSQLQVESFLAASPTSLLGIERFLGSGLVEGIGKELAGRLTHHFGLDTLKVIEESPNRLREVEGIGPTRAQRIQQAWTRLRDVRNLMVFLQSCGLSTAMARRIHAQYGERAAQLIRQNPWRLASEVMGIGFATADSVARNLGVPADSPQRAEAGVRHLLGQREEEGNVWAPVGPLQTEAAALLDLGADACAAAIRSLVARGELFEEQDPGGGAAGQVALARLARAEVEVARRLALIARTPAPVSGATDPQAAVARQELQSGIQLSAAQRDAARAALTTKVLLITGGPGTGKTTLVRAIAGAKADTGARVELCAPTGRAARRLAEATGRDAKTIHRLLEFSPQKGAFLRNADNPLGCDTLVVDEISMVDEELLSRLLAALSPQAGLILVGDRDQLPSVGPGNVMADLLAAGTIRTIALTEVFRQAERSNIVRNAHRINAGQLPERSGSEESDFFFIERSEPAEIVRTIRELVAERIPRRFHLDPRADVQVLTPLRKGELGVTNLNRELQQLLNPTGRSVPRAGQEFRAGDRVMQTKNDYERDCFNGDVGVVAEVNVEARRLEIAFDGRKVSYDWEDLDHLTLAYACSIHKSQGSEYPAVVIALHTQHYVLLRRNLLYTAVTRGKRLAVIVGSTKALAMAVKNAGVEERSTRLVQRLRESMGRPLAL